MQTINKIKAIISLSVFCLLFVTGIAQPIESKFRLLIYPYVNSDVGVSYAIGGQYKLDANWHVNVNLKYHQNPITDARLNNERLHHRFYAQSFVNHLGLAAGIMYVLPWKYHTIEPYIFYELTYFNMDARSKYLDATAANTGNPTLLKDVYYSDLSSFDNVIGIGIQSKIVDHLYINTKVGMSNNFVLNLPASEYSNSVHFNSSLYYAIGLQYAF